MHDVLDGDVPAFISADVGNTVPTRKVLTAVFPTNVAVMAEHGNGINGAVRNKMSSSDDKGKATTDENRVSSKVGEVEDIIPSV